MPINPRVYRQRKRIIMQDAMQNDDAITEEESEDSDSDMDTEDDMDEDEEEDEDSDM